MRRLLLLAIPGLALAVPWLWGVLRDLPTGATLRTVMESCQIAHMGGRDYALCPRRLAFEEFPKHLSDAVIASEDRHFYSHGGIRYFSVLGAIAQNVSRSLAEQRLITRRGASTITQQFARTIILDERDGVSRKVAEAVLALQIEQVWDKKQILAGYMNVVPHARGLNGFDAAARHFFGVPVGDLDLGEAALLVAMLPAPNNRDPQVDPDQAYDGAVRVLDRMQEMRQITRAEKRKAAAGLKTRIFAGKLKRGSEDYDRLEYRPYRDLAVSEAAQENVALTEDYRLITHMDPRLQAWTVAETKQVSGEHQAAGVFLRPTGQVLAISGSRDYVENNFNRAFKSSRSIGSAGKMFLLVAAHEKPGMLAREFSTDPVGPDDWPAEASAKCKGKMPLQTAIIYSCNRPFTWFARDLGGEVKKIVDRFEITPPANPLLVPLGGIETSPLRLARAYAAIANSGRLPDVRALAAVLGRRGDVVYNAETQRSTAIMSPKTALAVHNDLRGPVRLGTAKAANSKLAIVVGKTGTSSNNQDALFVGITQDYVGAIWIGDDKPATMTGIYGGGQPAKAFARITDSYYAWRASVTTPAKVVAEPVKRVAAQPVLSRTHVEEIAFFAALFLSGLLVRRLLRSKPRPRPQSPAVEHPRYYYYIDDPRTVDDARYIEVPPPRSEGPSYRQRQHLRGIRYIEAQPRYR